MPSTPILILGGGISGLAAGMASGGLVCEAADRPGGIDSSYYLRAGSNARLPEPPADGEAYRFEIGGGQWIFAADPRIVSFIELLAPCSAYARKSSVYLSTADRWIPYPIQYNLSHLGPEAARRAVAEISGLAVESKAAESKTMRQWLHRTFGPTLSDAFFDGFHALYTAGLYETIAPQDAHKFPVDLKHMLDGAKAVSTSVGCGATFLYPDDGLDTLTRRMAAKCDVRYGHRVASIDTTNRVVHFDNGRSIRYEKLISTLPLDKAITMAGLCVDFNADPYTSALVLNLGAERGPRCPDDHWVYVPRSESGFYRVGFYSHVSPGFLPESKRSSDSHVSIYIERAYPGGGKPDAARESAFVADAIAELRRWGWVGEVDVADATWIDSAYTWKWPESAWRESAIMTLESHGVATVGRYGRWVSQGIADSIRDGLSLGTGMKR